MKYRILSHTADLRLEVYGATIEELFKHAVEALADVLSPKTKDQKPRLKEARLAPQSGAAKTSAEGGSPPAGRAGASGGKNQELKTGIHLESANLNNLLVDFLNEILARSQINKAVYKIKSLMLKDKSLVAEIEGIKVPEFHEDVKAVTYHEVDIKKGPATGDKRQSLWSTKLVIDI